MRRKIIIALGALIAALLLFATTKPDTFRIERSISINATSAEVFAHVNDFHKWESWSPFEKLDTNMAKVFGGPDSGVGSFYEWKGNKNAGEGRMEIVESSPFTKILIKLDFLEPVKASNSTEFTFLEGSLAITDTEIVLDRPTDSAPATQTPAGATNPADSTVAPTTPPLTKVTWAMYGENKFLNKLMSVFMDMDKYVGPLFEEGLTNLKKVVEEGKR